MSASTLIDRANSLNAEGKYEEALVIYDQLLAQNEDNPVLLATVATILSRFPKSYGQAIALFTASLEGFKKAKEKPGADVYSNLGLAYKHAGDRTKATLFLEKAIKDYQPTANTLVNYGSLFVENGENKKAIDTLEQAVKIDPKFALAHWNLSLALLEAGIWERAWDEYEYGSAPGGMRPERILGGRPMWDGTPGKKVAVYGEQGIGDEIMFASMLPDLMQTNDVIFDCHPRLEKLFRMAWPDEIASGKLKTYPTRKQTLVPWVEEEQFDYRIAVGSLGKFFRRSRDKFHGKPFLRAQPLLPKGDRLRVGISWTGGRLSHRVARRTVPLNWWKPILEQDCEFVSLQYTNCEAEIADLEGKTKYRVKQYPEAQADDYYETARLTASCDLVITVTTSILHLAGGLGVPCWVMVPFRPDWRCGVSGPMPWYRSIRQYRQPADGNQAWLAVVDRIANDVSDLVASQKEKAA